MTLRRGRQARSLVALAVAAALVTGLPALGGSEAATQQAPPVAKAGTMVSGTSSYQRGTYTWTDYAYDDRGADDNGIEGGDTAYPAGLEPNNVADLVQLRLTPRRSGLRATALLETLTPASRPLLGLALDLDGPARGAPSLPGSWTASAPLGMDRLYLLGRGGGRELVANADGDWQVTRRFAVSLDDHANTVSGLLPIRLPTRGEVRAVAAVGYEDGTSSWVEGSAPVMDLGFVADPWLSRPYVLGVALDASGFVTGDNAYWQDGKQSAILAGQADPSPAVAHIDLGMLHRGVSRPAPLHPGFQTFLYRSSLRLGEGVIGSGNSALYAGPFQPYLVHLPDHLRPGMPLIVYMHGSSQTYTSPVNTSHYDPGTSMAPLPLPEKILHFGAVVAWPLGRGPQQGYDGAGEQDVLDVTDDVIGRLRLDKERVMLAGLSLGGIGAFRLGSLYPDRWSFVWADVGADQTDLIANMTALPIRLQNAVADPLVNVGLTVQTRQRLAAAGTVDYASMLQLRTTHQPAVKLAECLYRDGLSRTRVRNPVHVRYTIDPAMFVDDPRSGLTLHYTGAYWVSGMRAAGNRQAAVDLDTHAFGRQAVAGPVVDAVRENISAGRDFCGPAPDAQGQDVWSEQSRSVRFTHRAASGLLTGTLSGLSAVAIDARTAGLTRFHRSLLRLRTYHALALTVARLPRGSRVSFGSTTVTVGAGGRARLRLPAGRVQVRIVTP